jgi:hypothetical protein
MQVMTIPQPIPSDKLRRRVLEVDGSLYLVHDVRHRHVGGQLVTILDVVVIAADKFDVFDGHNWCSVQVAEVCGFAVRADG